MSYPKQIGPFKLYEKEPNDICFGAIYTLEVTLPLLYYKKNAAKNQQFLRQKMIILLTIM